MAQEPVARDSVDLTSVKTVKDSADYSKRIIEDMEEVADQAHTSLTGILEDALEAHTWAGEAKESAENASEYAARALGNLSTVQSVTETLNWITQHGTMTLTTDTQLDPTHVYFVRDNNGDYEVGDYRYSVVTEPKLADISTYYVLGIDESLNNYVGTHLALTDEGLSVLKAANGWRVLIKNDGVYIIDNLGRVVAKYKDSITLGNDDGSQSFMKEDYHSLQLFDKKNAEILNCDKYDSDSTYEVGDMVYRMDGGTKLYYKCKTAITVPIVWDSTYWERLYPSAYFHVSDLKDAHGIAEITETINIKSEGLTYVDVSYPIAGTDVHVSVNGSDATVTSWTVGGKRVTISQPVLHAGDVVVITYETNDDSDMFACTFGGRKTGSNVGTMSVAMGQNVEASGINSHAEGMNTTASGDCSHAEGSDTTASGQISHAEGLSTTASGDCSHAEGYQTAASKSFSHAEGFKTEANGRESHAEGYYTEASGEDSHAEGNQTVASGGTSHAEGEHTIASGGTSHAEGSYTEASGIESHAEGYETKASGTNSHAEGYQTEANGWCSHAQNLYTIAAKGSQTAIGKYNIEDTETTETKQKALIIGNGTSKNKRSNAFTVDWSGNVWAAGTITENNGTRDIDLNISEATIQAFVDLGMSLN